MGSGSDGRRRWGLREVLMMKLYPFAIYDCAIGTCRSEAEIAELCGVSEDEVMELAADAGLRAVPRAASGGLRMGS